MQTPWELGAKGLARDLGHGAVSADPPRVDFERSSTNTSACEGESGIRAGFVGGKPRGLPLLSA